MKDDVLIARLTGQPINVAPLYNPANGPSTQNVVNTAFQSEGLFLEGTFEKVQYNNPNGTRRRKPFIVGPELPSVYRGPDFVPTVNYSLQNETITPAGGIIMPPRLLNGFELALSGIMADHGALAKAAPSEVRDEVYDAVSSYRDTMKQDMYDKKVEHLMTQGYAKQEIEAAMEEKRKDNLKAELMKPTPVAPMTIQNALNGLVKRQYNEPAAKEAVATVRFTDKAGRELSVEERTAIIRGTPSAASQLRAPARGFGNVMTLAR